jgi:UDP-glucuronate 4-epimerase
VNEVLDTIASVTGVPLDVTRLDAVRGDVLRTGGDSALALGAIGWSPEVPLPAGIQRQWEWIRGL